jgi:hypothetical protein
MNHDDFNRMVRRAAGRAQPFDRRTPIAHGDLGGGRGGTCGPPPRPDPHTEINRKLRAALALKRGHLTLDDVIEARW